jgi:hypothetical protein
MDGLAIGLVQPIPIIDGFPARGAPHASGADVVRVLQRAAMTTGPEGFRII